jgi:hypothetical protein
VGLPAAESAYVTEHRPAERVHAPLERLKDPAPLVEVKLTVPPGKSPTTDAVQLMGEPAGADIG